MSTNNSSSTPKYKEYKIKSFLQSTNYHVMLMPERNTGSFSFADFVPPVKLYRNPKDSISIKSSPAERDELMVVSSNPKAKKRSQIITQFESPAQRMLKMEEVAPWVLEDSDGKSYSSRLEGGQQQRYVLFVNQVRPLEFQDHPHSRALNLGFCWSTSGIDFLQDLRYPPSSIQRRMWDMSKRMPPQPAWRQLLRKRMLQLMQKRKNIRITLQMYLPSYLI